MNITLKHLLNLYAMQTMIDSLHAVNRIPICILDENDNILISTSWQDLEKSMINRKYILENIKNEEYVSYLYDNGLYEIAIPVYIAEKYAGALVMGKFSYKDNFIEYRNIPLFSKLEINNLVAYYKILIYTLINEKKDNEEALERAQNEAKLKAEEATTTGDSFLVNLSHEFKTPVAVILNSVHLLNKYCDSKSEVDITKIKKYIGIVNQNCYRILRLVNNLIDNYRNEAGFNYLQLKKLDIVKLAGNISKSVLEYAQAKGVLVEFYSNLRTKIITVDPDKIERILLNLLSNAIKFTDKGGHVLVRINEKESKVIISVKDSGIGIPAEKLDFLFKRFNQISNSLVKNAEGSGIGLSLVKHFAELHGGKVSVYSKPGFGSEFTVELPDNTCSELSKNDGWLEDYNCFVDKLRIEFSDIYSDC